MPGGLAAECPATALTEVEGSPGTYSGTFEVPAGDYAYKAALNGSWAENYGAGEAAGGGDIALTSPGGAVTFTYNHGTHVITSDVPESLVSGAAAHWLAPGALAWDLTDATEGSSYRLYSAPDGGLEVTDGAVTGGDYIERPASRSPTSSTRSTPMRRSAAWA